MVMQPRECRGYVALSALDKGPVCRSWLPFGPTSSFRIINRLLVACKGLVPLSPVPFDPNIRSPGTPAMLCAVPAPCLEDCFGGRLATPVPPPPLSSEHHSPPTRTIRTRIPPA